MNKKNKKNKIFIKSKSDLLFVFIILFIFIVFCIFILSYVNREQIIFKNHNVRNQVKEFVKNFNINKKVDEYFDKDLDSLNIESKSFIIYDFKKEKIIASREPYKSLPLASVSKLMTSYVGMKYCPTIFAQYKESILINSSNEDSEKLSEKCFGDKQTFVDFMNRESANMSLNMFFRNSSGLDIDNTLEASNYGDIMSVIKLAEQVYQYDKGETFGLTLKKYSDQGIANTNKYVNIWPFLIASKTGFTDIANGNLVTLYNYNQDFFAIAVLGSTKDGRFDDTYKLLNYYLSSK
jgi:D-alanyl-D-alanine carboxypeptidase